MCLRNLILFILMAVSAVSAFAVSPTLEIELRSLLETKDAKIGVALIVNDNDTLTINNDERYPLMSVMKFHQALAVARFLQGNKLPLTATVPVKSSHLKPDTYSPLRERYPNGNVQVSYADLLKYTLLQDIVPGLDFLHDIVVGNVKFKWIHFEIICGGGRSGSRFPVLSKNLRRNKRKKECDNHGK